MRRPAEFRDIGQLARAKVQQIDEKMRALKSVRARLLSMIDQIETVKLRGALQGRCRLRQIHFRSMVCFVLLLAGHLWLNA